MLTTLVSLTACQMPQKGNIYNTSQNDEKNTLLKRAAKNAEADGDSQKTLALHRQIYLRNKNNPENVLRYATSLRKADQVDKAANLLSRFIDRQDNLNAYVLLRLNKQLAMAHLSQGNFELGQKKAQTAIDIGNSHEKRKIKTEVAKAYHILGIALDAQGQYKKAEEAFRQGLENWEGTPVPIMNNLALNLASQGYLDEAVKVMRKAKMIAPSRRMVERNYRILTAMNEKVSYRIPAPLPTKKPKTTSDIDIKN